MRWSLAAISVVGVDQVLGFLRSIVHARPGGGQTELIYSTILAQSHNLSDESALSDPGFPARQLCLHALEIDEPLLSKVCESYLRSLPDPGLVPVWTTRRTSRSFRRELIRNVESMLVLDDGRVVTGGSAPSSGGGLLLWDKVGADAHSIELGRDDAGINTITALADGRLVTGSQEGFLRIWDPAHPNASAVSLGRVRNGIEAVANLRDGRIIVASAKRYIDDMSYGFHSYGNPDPSLGHHFDLGPSAAGRFAD